MESQDLFKLMRDNQWAKSDIMSGDFDKEIPEWLIPVEIVKGINYELREKVSLILKRLRTIQGIEIIDEIKDDLNVLDNSLFDLGNA